MLTDIYRTSSLVGLNIHLGKTEVMINDHATRSIIFVDGKHIEEVDIYIYLDKKVSSQKTVIFQKSGEKLHSAGQLLTKYKTSLAF